jgi:6 kDa early secretory antigenic target
MSRLEADHEILIDFAALASAGDHITHAIAAVEQQLTAVEQAAAPLVATWAGAAKQAYADRQAAWRRAADDLTNVLRRVGSAVAQTAEDFAETERRNARRFE